MGVLEVPGGVLWREAGAPAPRRKRARAHARAQAAAGTILVFLAMWPPTVWNAVAIDPVLGNPTLALVGQCSAAPRRQAAPAVCSSRPAPHCASLLMLSPPPTPHLPPTTTTALEQLLFNLCLLLSQGTGLSALQVALEVVGGSLVGGAAGIGVTYLAFLAGGAVYAGSVPRAACFLCLVRRVRGDSPPQSTGGPCAGGWVCVCVWRGGGGLPAPSRRTAGESGAPAPSSACCSRRVERRGGGPVEPPAPLTAARSSRRRPACSCSSRQFAAGVSSNSR